jgi:hypothetical protein
MFSTLLIGSPSISGHLPCRVTFTDPNTWVLAYAELEATQRACTGRRCDGVTGDCDGLGRFVILLSNVLVFDRERRGAVLRDGGCSTPLALLERAGRDREMTHEHMTGSFAMFVWLGEI